MPDLITRRLALSRAVAASLIAPAAMGAVLPKGFPSKRLCSTPVAPPRGLALAQALNAGSQDADSCILAIELRDTRWDAGQTLHYFLMPSKDRTAADDGVVRNAFASWKQAGINLNFEEVNEPQAAEVRILFDFTTGASNSQVGTWCKDVASSLPTTRFGWPLSADAWGSATALHELGHALGLQHEHQSPACPLRYNAQKTDAYYQQYDNWSPQEVQEQVIERFDPRSVVPEEANSWDHLSIMQYPVPAEAQLLDGPEPYKHLGVPPNYTLSAGDIAWARRAYRPS